MSESINKLVKESSQRLKSNCHSFVALSKEGPENPNCVIKLFVCILMRICRILIKGGLKCSMV